GAGGGVLLEEGGGHLVGGLVGTLGSQDGGDEQFQRRVPEEFVLGVRVLLVQPLNDDGQGGSAFACGHGVSLKMRLTVYRGAGRIARLVVKTGTWSHAATRLSYPFTSLLSPSKGARAHDVAGFGAPARKRTHPHPRLRLALRPAHRRAGARTECLLQDRSPRPARRAHS